MYFSMLYASIDHDHQQNLRRFRIAKPSAGHMLSIITSILLLLPAPQWTGAQAEQ